MGDLLQLHTDMITHIANNPNRMFLIVFIP